MGTLGTSMCQHHPWSLTDSWQWGGWESGIVFFPGPCWIGEAISRPWLPGHSGVALPTPPGPCPRVVPNLPARVAPGKAAAPGGLDQERSAPGHQPCQHPQHRQGHDLLHPRGAARRLGQVPAGREDKRSRGQGHPGHPSDWYGHGWGPVGLCRGSGAHFCPLVRVGTWFGGMGQAQQQGKGLWGPFNM